MSWCTAEQVADLISVARLRGDVDQATRKSADLRFLDLCANAVNAGDVLIHVATEGSASPALRLNALLAVETLFTNKGWCEGAQFSDRSTVTKRLLHLVATDPYFLAQRKVDDGLLRCLAMIVALEFPTTEWQEWVRQCAVKFAEGDARSCAVLCAVVAESYRNYCLWSFLANDVVGFLLHAQIMTLPLRTTVMRLFLDLMRKRPRPSVDHEVASAKNCLLLSAVVRQLVLAALLERVEESGQLTGSSSDIFVADCTASFAVASRLVTDAESASILFRCSSFFLVRLQAVAAASGCVVPTELRDFTEQLLECLIVTLQLYPNVAGADFTADGLLSCLIYFMIRPGALERADAAQLSAELLEYFIDDEAVPLGCGSGDAANLAAAVLELYLEHHSAQRPLAVVALNGLLRATPVMDGCLTEAVALALRSVSRVYEASEDVVVDALDDAVQVEMLTQVSQLLLRTTDPHAHVMLIDALTHCFYRSQNQSLCTQLVELLQQLYMSRVESRDDYGECVRCACVYVAGRLVDELRSREWCGQLLPPEWIPLAMQQLCNGDAFGVFSAASTLCTLLCVAPASAVHISRHVAVWEEGLSQLCHHATLRSVAALLTLTLKRLSGLSLAPSALASLPHNCELVTRSCNVVLGFCRTPSPSRHLVLRSLVNFFADHTRTLLRGDAPAVASMSVSEPLSSLAAALLTEEYALELAQDEPSCRGLATFAAVHCIACGSVQPSSAPAAASALVSVLQYAVQQRFASQTISCVCSHLTCVLLTQPAQLDEAAPRVLHALFRDSVDIGEGRKGANYGGVAFLISVLLLRSPHALIQSACLRDASGAVGAAEHLTGLQRGFGWWLSLAPFMDTIQFLYFTAATCRLVDAVVTLPPEVLISLGCLKTCCQYILPSAHVKKLPSRPLAGGHLLQHLAVAWIDIDRRYSRTSKPQLLEKELHPFLLSLDSLYELLCGQSFSSSTARNLVKASPSETTAAVLGYMEHLGWADVLSEARQQVLAARV
ncbi:conserved hypothetical protein [Leishmania infantum JPCM5]|uniref:Uncharacterized protein n=2 Tax=Leishmania infantum TaxID=5671 RepID=A4I9F5_LEIIN|nr:conserved hypothetical protein [Leishmania infantum JPCM5]CAC9534933.1 hypothetical_protein_-_conserved [Leishmania infantum]CAM71458.1 conserved hypothetical protein [Leishmania infantum JPCM5]SUZ45346.1 hypothetical_protein_-_conserved [Leishmania infantum]|eukprot:XP_001468374.1 conserved hypothetical protein [Leishmania infantum JPCM5]